MSKKQKYSQNNDNVQQLTIWDEQDDYQDSMDDQGFAESSRDIDDDNSKRELITLKLFQDVIIKQNPDDSVMKDFAEYVLSPLLKASIGVTAKGGKWIEEKLAEPFSAVIPEGRLHEIPCIYEGPDLAVVAKSCGISETEVIQIHSEKIYHVYFLGFLPGFAYMGLTDERITISRKEKPVTIQAGDIGLAGNQTGIYPSTSPGGWQIIGRTNTIPHFRAGDRVRFIPVTT